MLGNISLPKDAIQCCDINCKNSQHINDLCVLDDLIVKSLHAACRPFYKFQCGLQNIKPGWNEHVAGLHAEARRAFKAWIVSGRDRQGLLFKQKKRANAHFKYALRYIKRNENSLRSESLACKLQYKNYNDFWKEIRAMNSSKLPLPTDIEGASGSDAICQMWRQHYSELFNCHGRNNYEVEYVHNNENVVINSEEIQSAVLGLDDNKAYGADKITAEHLKYASRKLITLLAICMTGFLGHGSLPDAILPVAYYTISAGS